ncbi:MAG: hypothetical protein HY698_04255 [Deltaproteobacteria bacterium]|nr:hypothetical protein [Deltaproteobacteria bacterium]
MHQVLVLAAAKAPQDPPIIDLDSTVFLQLGIFLFTAIVLSRLLFKPYLAVRAAREAGIDGAREEARRMEEEARARLADYDAKLSQARHKTGEERIKFRSEATAREREITEAARARAQEAVNEARRKIDGDAAAARVALEARVQDIARFMAKKILGREVA